MHLPQPGQLPAHRTPTEQEWEDSGYSRRGFPVIGPAESIRDHPGFDKIVILAVSPQFLDGELIGTADSYGITGVPGEPSPEKCNDYVAAIMAAQPDVFIGYASVNPAYRGPRAAVRELERAVTELGLTGLKLYPMYQDWSPADPVLAFPVFEKAQELGIPVMVHQAGSTRIDARMEYARPALLDAAGRHFRELRLTIAHCGLPWVDEALFMLTMHPNFLAELSYYIATVTPGGAVPLPGARGAVVRPAGEAVLRDRLPRGFLYDPVALRAKLLSVNDHAERVGYPPIPQSKLDGILGDHYARMLGLRP